MLLKTSVWNGFNLVTLQSCCKTPRLNLAFKRTVVVLVYFACVTQFDLEL